MAKTNPRYRVVVQLDPRIALEAILLSRLDRIPATRRQEWLRGLLMLGFRAECQTLRSTSEDTPCRPTTAFTTWLAGAMQKTGITEASLPTAQTKRVQENIASKPFAALGKVIG